MKELTVTKNDAGQRLDRFLAKAVPLLPASLCQKYIRLKRIKVDGKRADRDTRLVEGSVIQLYINDEFFDTPKPENAYLTVSAPKLNLVYEDDNLLLVDKKPGQAVHPHDGAEYGKTLIDHIQAYLYAKGEWRPREEHAFAPALCNRIDRNTGGIVIAAKNAEALRILNQKIKDRELEKRYLCVVHGRPKPAAGRLEGWIFKDAVQNRVYVTQKFQPGAKSAVTEYRTLKSQNGLSLVECELITGRTHQIRAMMAAAGTPLLGDGKYGKLDKQYDRKFQALYSYRLKFTFTTDAGILQYLDGREFQVEQVDFVTQYFGE
ncbi:MAG: RluA family pseudouridine synthase [Oscillospiraceae bacterium]|jgi:23S rRNA pseudouridine955/2504/2580 synthase|nr:RluA family pseudouridine synthase [Oscillospiraceae bacterium]MBQ2144380.1 RluA family pseudouridine synthase [Oscillospiraceae bacterium]MBQ2328586.1 RluA family pseudouridine synthase [Oscillospiraceae bacterium]MBQ5467300.1 RluA family pseudouridine synthase [Oscillospiraceae bacterium]MEE3459576.1 RluA family pseudouridine synthase [Candidatus Faecousia sp.]